MVLKAARKQIPDLTKKDCYRTPLSGGHPMGDPGDLVMSPRLRAIFPYLIEAKHRKDWKVEHIFVPTAAMAEWVEQAVRAANKLHLTPVVVVRGHHTNIFCFLPHRVGQRGKPVVLAVKIGPLVDPDWVAMRFGDFLTEVL
jgi:hypothetical protein